MPVTIRDIAKRLNLSHATVSFVLNDRRDVTIPEATRARVRDMAAELGYVPNAAARALALGRSGIVAVRVSDLTAPPCALALSQLAQLAQAEKVTLILGEAHTWPVDAVLELDELGEISVERGQAAWALPKLIAA